MSPNLFWITIIHVLLWNFIFCLSECVGLNKDSELSRYRVRCSTHKRDCLKNTPPIVDHNIYEPVPDSDEVDNFDNPGLAKDLNVPSYPVKRHVSLRCHNCPGHENKKLSKSDLITSEGKIKCIHVNNAYGDSMVKKSKVVGLKKIDINSQEAIYHESLHHTVPPLQKGNLIGKNSKHSQLQLKLQDKTNQIKPLISTPQHKLGEIISDKLVDETLHNKLAVQPSLTLPLPYKLIKHSVINQLIQPTEIHNNIDTVGLITDSDKQSNPLKLSPLLSPNNQKDLKNKLFSTPPSVELNEPKPVDILLRDRSPPQTPVIKPIHLPILVQKEVTLSSANERPRANVDSSSQYPKVIKNGIAESTSQRILIEKYVSISSSHNKQQESIDLPPIQSVKTSDTAETVNKPITIIEKKVSMYCPHKNLQDSIESSPPKQYMKTSNTESVLKPIKIEKEVSLPAPNEQKQPIVNLALQAPQLIKTPESIYQEIPEHIIY